MPAYGKFLKEILSNKRKLEDFGEVKMSSGCSGLIKIMKEKMPPKLKDPGSFCVPIGVGDVTYDALCDLGASVSIIPLAICRKIGLGEPKPVKMTLYMADRSITCPVGIVEDVPVKLGKFYVPIDFVVLEIPDSPVLIILGRPFLVTSGCMVDCKNARLAFDIGEEKVEFVLSTLVKEPTFEEDIFNIHDEELSREEVSSILFKDPLQKVISMSIMDIGEEEECNEEIEALEKQKEVLIA